MKTATRPPVRNRTHLLEQVQFTKPLRVDREAGIIYDALILGKKSKNGWDYDDAALDKAVRDQIFESAKCYIGHPPKETPHKERDKDHAFGRFFETYRAPDGVRGNLKFLPNHKDAQDICDDAEQGIGMFGLSPNMDGDKRSMPDGSVRIMEIYGPIRSVDIVTRPATTTSLSESHRITPMKPTVWNVFDLMSADKRAPIKTRRVLLESMDRWEDEKAKGKPCVATAMEAEMDMPTAMEDPAAPLDHNQILSDGFMAAAKALLDEDKPTKETMKRMAELLKSKGQLLGDGTSPDETLEEDEDEEADKTPMKELKESVQKLTRTNRALTLCMESGVKPEPWLLNSMSLMESEQEQRQVLHGFKLNSNPKNTPRSQTPPAPNNSKAVDKGIVSKSA